MMREKITTSMTASLLVLTGCAAVPQEPGFARVRADITERVGQETHWYQGGAEDQAVIQRLRALLAQPLNPDTAVQIALLNNRRLQATFEGLGVAQANLVQAGLLKNPVLDAVVKWPAGGGKATLDLGIVQEFITIFSLPLRRKLAAAEFEAAKLSVTIAVMDLAGQVRSAFYQLQTAAQSLELMNQVNEATAAALEAAQQLHDAGNITDLDLFNEQALHYETRLALAAAEAAVAAARERINVLLGLWGQDVTWTFDPQPLALPEQLPDLSEIETRAVGNSLDLALARQRIEAATRKLALTGATAVLPELELGIEGEYGEGVWERGPGIGLELPLFDQGRGERAAAGAELRRAQADYTALAVELRAAARRAKQDVRAAYDRARYLQQVVLPLSERIVEGTLLTYNAMQVGVFQLLQAQRSQVLSVRQYFQALRDYGLAQARLEQLLSGRMAAPDASSAASTSGAANVTSPADNGDH